MAGPIVLGELAPLSAGRDYRVQRSPPLYWSSNAAS